MPEKSLILSSKLKSLFLEFDQFYNITEKTGKYEHLYTTLSLEVSGIGYAKRIARLSLFYGAGLGLTLIKEKVQVLSIFEETSYSLGPDIVFTIGAELKQSEKLNWFLKVQLNAIYYTPRWKSIDFREYEKTTVDYVKNPYNPRTSVEIVTINFGFTSSSF